MSELDLIKQITSLQRQVDGLIKPEVPLGLSLISETILTVNTSSVTLSNIPQQFRHLLLITQLRNDDLDYISFKFNGIVGVYDEAEMSHFGTTLIASVIRSTNRMWMMAAEGPTSRAANYSPGFALIFGYSSSTIEKMAISMTMQYGPTAVDADIATIIRSGRWRNTAAITSVQLVCNLSSLFLTGCKFQLYGIK